MLTRASQHNEKAHDDDDDDDDDDWIVQHNELSVGMILVCLMTSLSWNHNNDKITYVYTSLFHPLH